jgi:hypothetical protein
VFRTVRAVVLVLAAAAGLTAATSGAGQAATPAATPVRVQVLAEGTNTIYNYSDVGLGIIQYWDGNYYAGHYDRVLPPQVRNLNGSVRYVENSYDYFGWYTTAGFYIGPGYCADLYRHDFGLSGPWQYQGRIGPGEHPIGSNTSYRVNAFRPMSGSCA